MKDFAFVFFLSFITLFEIVTTEVHNGNRDTSPEYDMSRHRWNPESHVTEIYR